MEPTNRNRKGSMPVPLPPVEVQMPVDAPLISEEEIVVEEPVVSTKPPESSSIKTLKPISKLGIKVVALRNGFWKNCRHVEGSTFTVPDMDKVGDWMKCVDPGQEKQHQVLAKERKLAAAGK